MKILCLLSAFFLCNACSSTPAPDEPAKITITAPELVQAATPPLGTPRLVTTPDTVTPPPGSLASRPDVQAFIREMAAKHGFSEAELRALFSRAQAQSDIIALITRPAESKPWYDYREIFIVSQRIRGGVEFWRRHQQALQRAEQTYGVPAEIIVAIIGVETMYGGNTGRHRVLEALATLAFDYPRRADFFRKELENYLLLTRDEGIDPLSLKGSYAGAMGLGQFMPSSYRAYAVDFDGDRQRDLWHNPVDAIGSVANYLSEHRWQRGEPITTRANVGGSQYRALSVTRPETPRYTVASLRQRGVIPQAPVADDLKATLVRLDAAQGTEYWLGFYNFYAITRYNRSVLYAMAVYQLSQAIRAQRTG